ncbi:MAG: MT-A70 family methyltransferase [Candidatus Dormibacteria bacterium]
MTAHPLVPAGHPANNIGAKPGSIDRPDEGLADPEPAGSRSLAVTPVAIMAMLERHEQELMLVEEPREAAQLVDRVDAIKYLAEKARASLAVQNRAAEVALRARRRAGEVLAAMPKQDGGDAMRARSHDVTEVPQSLDDLGITRNDSSRWQAIASLSDERFEGYIAQAQTDGRELTAAGAVAIARTLKLRDRHGAMIEVPPPEGSYRCLVIDPPWPIERIEREVRPNQDALLAYPTMTVDEIAELPIPELAHLDGCHVYLWVTHRFLPDGLRLFSQWGVRYQCVMTWVKNVGMTPFSWMYDTEHVLFGRVGSLPLLHNGLRLSFTAPTTEHSEKPAIFYARAAAASPEPRLEMFTRAIHHGFEAWGNEVASVG